MVIVLWSVCLSVCLQVVPCGKSDAGTGAMLVKFVDMMTLKLSGLDMISGPKHQWSKSQPSPTTINILSPSPLESSTFVTPIK